MEIGGLQKLTLVDYPGQVAATVFTIGCNFRCPFCYSGELVLPEKIKNQPRISEEYFFDFLKKRVGKLEGVVLCGGEPTLHKDLPQFTEKIKDLGFLVKLDTNGSNPNVLKDLVEKNLIDYVAMDVKAPEERYEEVTGGRADIQRIEESVDFLKQNQIDYEFRTTVVPELIKKEDILKIAKWISPAKRYFLQEFRAEKTIDPKFEKVKAYSDDYLSSIKESVSSLFETCEVR